MPDRAIPVGVVLSVTGRFSAAVGEPMRHGFDLALEEVNSSQHNGRQIRFIIADDESTVAGVVEAYNKLIRDGVPVILGPVTSSQTEAAFPIAPRQVFL